MKGVGAPGAASFILTCAAKEIFVQMQGGNLFLERLPSCDGSRVPKGPCCPHFTDLSRGRSKPVSDMLSLSAFHRGNSESLPPSASVYEAAVVSEFMPGRPELMELCHPVITPRDKFYQVL